MDQILQLEIEIIVGIMAVCATTAIAFIASRLYDIYTKREVNELLALLRDYVDRQLNKRDRD